MENELFCFVSGLVDSALPSNSFRSLGDLLSAA